MAPEINSNFSDRIKITICQKSRMDYNSFFKFLWSFMNDEVKTYKPDFLIFPEYYLTNIIDGERPFTNPYLMAASRVASQFGCYIILGSIKEKFQDSFYNTTFVIGQKGELITRYRKQRPWRNEQVSSGTQVGIFDTFFGKVGILICFDSDAENDEVMKKLLAEKPRFIFIPIDMSIPSYYHEENIRIATWKNAIRNVSMRFFPLACKHDVTFIRADFPFQNNIDEKMINYGTSIILKPYHIFTAPTWKDCCFSTFVEDKMYKSEVGKYAVDLDADITLENYYSFIDNLTPN